MGPLGPVVVGREVPGMEPLGLVVVGREILGLRGPVGSTLEQRRYFGFQQCDGPFVEQVHPPSGLWELLGPLGPFLL